MATKWTDKEASRLIEWYHINEHLWNRKMKDYHQQKDERTRDIRLIANELSKPEAEIGKKWHNLKTTFGRIHKRLAGKSGDPALDPNATKWIHYEELLFVKSVLNDPSTSSLTASEFEPITQTNKSFRGRLN